MMVLRNQDAYVNLLQKVHNVKINNVEIETKSILVFRMSKRQKFSVL